jgi:peptide/nickel transport system ATP-binding protein
MSTAVSSAAILEIRDLSLSIGGARVVDGLSCAVRPGEVLALVGESGCGKSLTALAAIGLLPHAVTLEGGEVLLDGENLVALPERRLRSMRGRRIAMIFQEPLAALDQLATVGTQVAEATGRSVAAAREEVLAMLAEVGISDPARRIAQYPFELSGGMAQRVMIATALISRPAVLIADEPTTALDVTIQAQILDLLRRLAVDRGTAIVLITHDMGVVADIAERVAVMYAGRIAETGPAAALFARPRHPYTALLLAALPRLSDEPKAPLAVIQGQVPLPSAFSAACRFADRCPLATERCRAEQPPLRDMGEGRQSACWHAELVQ